MPTEQKDFTQSEAYQALQHAKHKLIWPLLALTIGVYMAFILTIAFAPEVLAAPIGDGVVSRGIMVGLALIVFNFLITLYYVRRANHDIEPLIARVQAEAGER